MKQTASPNYPCKPAACLRRLAGTLLILLACGSLFAPAQADDIYKWADESGEIQYTQMPPPHGTKAIRIQSAPPPVSAQDTADTPSPAQTAGKPANDKTPAAEQDKVVDTTKRDSIIAQTKKENCKTARNNLISLNRGQIRYIKPDGEVYRLTEEERQQSIEEANTQIKEFCKN